jgi:hypothetical protein
MTQRERKLMTGLLATVGGLAVLLGFHKLFWEPFQQTREETERQEDENSDKRRLLRRRLQEKREFMRLQKLSLPADPNPHHQDYDLARFEYEKLLRKMAHASKLKAVHVIPGPPPVVRAPVAGRPFVKPLYTPLTYTVQATGDLAGVVALFERFYRTPLLHQIKSFSLKPARGETGGRGGGLRGARELDLKMTVEALLLQGAEKRTYLMPGERQLLALSVLVGLRGGPAGLALVPYAIDQSGLLRPQPLEQLMPSDEYAYIARKDFFFGPPPTSPVKEEKDPAKKRKPPAFNPNRFIILTDITRDSDGNVQAHLYDQATGGRAIKLDPNDERYNSLPVLRDTEHENLIRGEIVHVTNRDIVFQLRLVARREKDDDNGEKIIWDEAKKLYRIDKAYWEALVEEETLFTNDEMFYSFRDKLMMAEVEKTDDRFVYFKVDKKYFDRYYAIHIDQDLLSALGQPLERKELRAFGVKEAAKRKP